MRTVRSALIVAWPFLASLALGAIIVASIVSVGATFSQREGYERQAVAVEQLLERQQEQEAAGRARLAEALAEVERITTERFAEHDARLVVTGDELLRRIAALLERPSGVTVDPVAATIEGETPAPLAPLAPRPSGGKAAPTTTTATAPSPTTTPAPGCDKKGQAKKC